MAKTILTSREARNLRRSLAAQLHLDAHSHVPLHSQLKDELAKVILTGFNQGDQFFAERELVEALQISRITVRRALDDLAKQGKLTRNVGRGGTTVQSSLTETSHLIKDNRRSSQEWVMPTAIGLFAPDWESEAANAIIGHFAAACRRKGMQIRLHWLHQNETVETILAQSDENSEEAAFVLNLGSEANTNLYQTLIQRGYKTVSTDPMPPGYTGDVVATDPRAAVRIGLEHLFALGHQRIVLLVNEPIRDKSVVDKIDEFLFAMSQAGLSLDARVVICGTQAWQNSHEAAFHHMPEVWDRWAGQKPTAIFTVSDPGAWAVLKWFRERGIDVPGTVSVIGFENAASSEHVTPALTTLAHPVAESVERCLEVLRTPLTAPSRIQLIAPLLIVRESTGPAQNEQTL